MIALQCQIECDDGTPEPKPEEIIMRCRSLPALSAVLLAFSAPAQEKADLPASAPPQFLRVVAVDADKGQLRLMVCKLVAESFEVRVTRKAVIDGVERELGTAEKRVRMKPVCEESIWKIGELSAIDGSGQRIDPKDLPKRVHKGDTVLHVVGDKVDPVWLKIVRPEAVILLTPPVIAPPAPGASAGAR
jgi:hypothetical protein